MRVTVIPVVNDAFGTVPPRLRKGTGGIRNQWTNRDHPNHSTVNIGHNTEKSPGNMRKFAVTQIPVKDHQLMLM